MEIEVELQYVLEAEEQLVVPVSLAGFDLRAANTVEIVDTYYDTNASDLRRAGCSLRLRRTTQRPPELVWKGPSRRRPDGAKEREEVRRIMTPMLLLERWALDELVLHSGLRAKVEDVCGGGELHAVGELRNRRSNHEYVSGHDRLELSWDRLEFPVGPRQTRLELEALSRQASEFLVQADSELHAIFGDRLQLAPIGKARELYERLRSEFLVAA